jgi:hypothetical protein
VSINVGTIELNVCGYSWREDVYGYDANGNWVLLVDYCDDNELVCGTTYVFRAFAHNVPTGSDLPFAGYKRSPFSGNLCCNTLNCGFWCVYTMDYWRRHGPGWDRVFCNKGPNEWPQSVLDNGLVIAGTVYSAYQLCANFGLVAGPNAVLILSHQLIAAMLNLASGATAPNTCDVEAASALLTGYDINSSRCYDPEHHIDGCADYAAMMAASICLDSYNNGGDGPPHCP